MAWILMAFLTGSLLMPSAGAAYYEDKILRNDRHLMFILDTRQYYKDDRMYLAQAPHRVIDGVTFISMRSFAERLGFDVRYRASENEYYMTDGENELAYVFGASEFRHNGEVKPFRSGTSHVVNGSLMIPLRETASSLGIRVTPELSARKVHLNWTEERVIRVPVEEEEAEESFSISLTADEETYRIGEEVGYLLEIDGIPERDASINWTGRESYFFEEGRYRVSVEVTGPRGTVETAHLDIDVTDEVYRTREQYDLSRLADGGKFTIDRAAVLNYELLEPVVTEDDMKLIRSNSPERITSEGIFYEDTVSGDVRLLIHHQNARLNPAQMYVMMRNRSDEQVTVTQGRTGIGGPTPFVHLSGRSSVLNYLNNDDLEETWTFAPGQSRQILQDYSNRIIGPEETMTLYTDLHVDGELEMEIIALESRSNFARTYPFLGNIRASHDNRHTRGQFDGANRELLVGGTSGETNERVVIGSPANDRFVEGIDAMSGESVTNYGNRGVHYTLRYERVAPHTALVINPRGGSYSGAFKVNGNAIPAPASGTLAHPGEALKLYQTGDEEEEVVIEFIPASGSNLPIAILSMPLKSR